MAKNYVQVNITPTLSRQDLIKWVNSSLGTSYKKIEELGSGVAYCQLIDSLFPGAVALKRVKCHAKLEHEFIDNFKLVQQALAKLRIDKTIEVERLVKCRFQDNIEFAQWFKNFFDLNSESQSLESAEEPKKERTIKCASTKSCKGSTSISVRKFQSGVETGRASPAKSTRTTKPILMTKEQQNKLRALKLNYFERQYDLVEGRVFRDKFQKIVAVCKKKMEDSSLKPVAEGVLASMDKPAPKRN